LKTRAEFNAKVAELKRELEPSNNKYEHSGPTPPATTFIIGLSSFLAAGSCYLISRVICAIYDAMFGNSVPKSWNDARGLGIPIFFVNIIIAFLFIFGIGNSLAAIGRRVKLRNPIIAQVFAFLASLIACVLLYFPFGDRTVVPVDLGIIVIPLNGLIVTLGCFGIPLVTSLHTGGKVEELRYCKTTGQLLETVLHTAVGWEQARRLVQALKEQELDAVPEIISSATTVGNPHVTLSLSGHPQAEEAYIDVKATFTASNLEPDGTYQTDAKAEWLAFHQRLSQGEARTLVAAMPAHTRKISL